MPFIVPFLPLIISGATAGIQMGMQLAGVGQPSPGAANEAMQKQQQDALTQQHAQTVRAAQDAARQYAPNLQAQLGGAVSPDYYAQVTAANTGYGDQVNAVRQALAQQGIAPQQGGSSLNLTSTNFTQPQGGSFSFNPFQQGVSGIPGQGPGNYFDIIQSLSGGSQFHGGGGQG